MNLEKLQLRKSYGLGRAVYPRSSLSLIQLTKDQQTKVIGQEGWFTPAQLACQSTYKRSFNTEELQVRKGGSPPPKLGPYSTYKGSFNKQKLQVRKGGLPPLNLHISQLTKDLSTNKSYRLGRAVYPRSTCMSVNLQKIFQQTKVIGQEGRFTPAQA